MASILFLALLVISSSQATEIILSEEYSAKVTYTFPSETKIRLSFNFKNEGYIGFGFGIMQDADIFVCNFQKGVPHVKDYNSNGLGILIDEPQQDWVMISAARKDGFTNFVVERELDTKDPKDHTILLGKPQRTVWAFGKTDKIGYHFAHRGAIEELVFYK